jgi:ribosomal protein L11 methyltransferase
MIQATPLGSRGFLWQILCTVPEPAVDIFEEYLRRYCFTVSSSAKVNDTTWRIEGLSEAEPDRDEIERRARALANDLGFETPSFLYDLQPPINWEAENLASFPPIRWQRYFIHGSHYDDPIPGGLTPLLLNAGTAFGSGEHPTTGGCLLALDRLARRRSFKRPLDVGCGSGILSIAAAKTWNVPVLAADIDPVSVQVTVDNARLNKIGHMIQSVCSDGYKHRKIARNGPYDLILANILARPLAKLSRDLDRHLMPGGVAVVSGIIERDIAWMVRVHRLNGLYLIKKTVLLGWATLVFGKP